MQIRDIKSSCESIVTDLSFKLVRPRAQLCFALQRAKYNHFHTLRGRKRRYLYGTSYEIINSVITMRTNSYDKK